MPPKKKVPSGDIKKTKAFKTSRAAPKSQAAKPRASAAAPVPRNQGGAPLYVLTIMILLAAIAFAGTRFYDKIFKDAGQTSPSKNVSSMKTENDKHDSNTKKEEPEKITSVKLYMLLFDDKTEKIILTPVSRKVEGDDYIEKTMRSLMKGPTAAEKGRGILTAIEADTKLIGIALNKKILELDFNSPVSRGAGGGIVLNRIDQIVYTATQFSEVDAVMIKINGKRASTLGSDGISVSGPLRRRK